MTDQLFFSIWLEKFSRRNRMRHFETLLRIVPFSQREQSQSVISIQGVGWNEPPLLERPLNGPVDVSEVLEAFKDYQGDDVAYRLESWWDLWQYENDWLLAPARIAFSCFGPEFETGAEREGGEQEDLRIDFGLDSNYLPQPEIPGSSRLIESNIKSLLRLVHELDSQLPVETRKLETESGENFANRLQEVLQSGRGVH